MKTKFSLLSLVLIGASSSLLSAASVTIAYDFEALRKTDGSPLSASCVKVLVADSDGDGILPTAAELAGVSLSEGTIIGGTDITNGDRIFSAGTSNGFYGPQHFEGSKIVDYDGNGVETAGGTIWGVYWFPTITTLLTPVAVGTPYGVFHSSLVDSAASIFSGQTLSAMVFPATGGSALNAFYYDPSVLATGPVSPTANTPTAANFTASYVVVPEPATATLSLLGLAALLRRRRN